MVFVLACVLVNGHVCMQAHGNANSPAEVVSLRQEVKGLLRELDSLAQGADHPEVKRFACKHHLLCQSHSCYC